MTFVSCLLHSYENYSHEVDKQLCLDACLSTQNGYQYNLCGEYAMQVICGGFLFGCRNPFQVTDVKMLVEGAAKMAEQLQELYEEVKRIIDNGDVESARDIIEANYDALREQLELGVEGIEHAAMLDILAQLRLTLGDFEEAEHLLLEVSFLL
jgi:hypothetical protein